MPQCKISDCREEAQKYGPRLCPEHARRREERRKATFSKPRCAHCGTQHTNHVDDAGVPMCPSCENKQEIERLDEKTRDWAKTEALEHGDHKDLLASMFDYLWDQGWRPY